MQKNFIYFSKITSQSYFITATDTGVGKTFVTVELGKYFQSLGYTVGVFKPFSSGGREDAVFLKEALELDDDLDLINPIWFEEPLAPFAVALVTVGLGFKNELEPRLCSPLVRVEEYPLEENSPLIRGDARRAEGFELNSEDAPMAEGFELNSEDAPMAEGFSSSRKGERTKILSAFNILRTKYDILLVEGIGGVLVPLWENYFVADLIRELGLPVLLVSRAGLGTLNHTLLSIEALQHRQIAIEGLILNGYKGVDLAEKSNKEVLTRLTTVPVLAEVPLR